MSRRLPSTAVAATGALCVLAGASHAYATTYQVGPTRTHTSLGQVVDLLEPGDVVEVDGDHTYAGGVTFENAGTSAQKITIRGVRINGNRPILSGGNNTIEARANHYVFEGLELTGGSSRCFYHHADDITLRDSLVRDCPQQGVLGGDFDSGSLLMEYVELYNNGEGTQNHQVYMATDETAYPGSVFRMQYCYVHDGAGGNNVKSRAERNEIYYNWIEGAMYHEVELIGPDGQDPGLAREDSDVVGNVLVKRANTFVVRFGGDGTGETNGRYRFVNNTVVVQQSGSAVFRLFDGLESLSVHNNVFFAMNGGTVNMVREVEASWSDGVALVSGSNNWVSSGATNVPGSWSGTIFGNDPGFVDSTGRDVRPLSASALVDAGAASTPDPSGAPFTNPLAAPEWHPPLGQALALGAAASRPSASPIDIGAFEYGEPGSGEGGGAGNGPGGSGSGGDASGGGSAGGDNGGGSSSGPGGGDTSGSGAGGGDNGGDGGGDPPDDGCQAGGPGAVQTGAVPFAAALLYLLGWRRRRQRSKA